MKTRNVFSAIILAIQICAIMYLMVCSLVPNFLLMFIQYGIYMAIPFAMLGVLLNIVQIVSSVKNKGTYLKNIVFALVHILLGLGSFVVYNSLLHI